MQTMRMPSIEAIIKKIFSDERLLFKVVIGGVLMLTVIGIPWVLGYFYGYAQQVRMRGKLQLPDWEGWDLLLVRGIKMIGVTAVCVGLPTLLVIIGIGLIKWLLGAWSGLFVLGICSVYLLVVPLVWVAGILRYQRFENLRSLLMYRPIMNVFGENWRGSMVPVLTYVGFLVVGAPVFTFAFFLGTNLLIAYLFLVFNNPNSIN